MNHFCDLRIIKFIIIILLCVSCGEQNFTYFSNTDFKGDGTLSNVIVNDLNWVESSDPRVALLLIPKSRSFMGRCTGFMISEKWLMTNNHCVKNEEEARGLKAIFGYNSNSSLTPGLNQRSAIPCDKMVATNSELDFSILECQRKPGKLFGWVSLEEQPPTIGTELYIVHQNCDYFSNENCFPTKKRSAGKVLDSSLFGEKLENSDKFFHDADILQGSSGAPIFDRDSKKVMGLLNVEYRTNEDNYDGRGPMNGAIKISSIFKYLKDEAPYLYEALKSKGNGPISFSKEDVIIKGRYFYPDFGDHYTFTLEVELKESKDFNNISEVSYFFFQNGKRRVIRASNRKLSFKKVFSVSNSLFEGFIEVYLKDGNKIKKEFRFQAKNKFPNPGDQGFELDEITVDYNIAYDKLMDRFIYSIKLLGERKSLQEIKSVSYSLLSNPNVNIDKLDSPFQTRLVTTKKRHNLTLLVRLKNGSFQEKEIQCYVPPAILKQRREHKKKQNQSLIKVGAKVKKDKDLIYFFGRPVFKFMVYLDAPKRDLSKIEQVDYFFKDSWDKLERKITSFNRGFKFRTPVFRTLNRSLSIYKTKITFKSGREKVLKGVSLSEFEDFPL
ncbi:MAG: hypothetical protein CME68_02760 [Halobacteriovoraceae bacterium]|nr:hypothetical protein [Halobacteriovoraceae bacterium]